MKAKIDHLEEDLKEEKENRLKAEDKFVTMQHFTAVVQPMQQQLKEVGRDVKKILVMVSSKKGKECEDD